MLLARELLRDVKREILALKVIRRFLVEHIIAYQKINLSLQECASLLLGEDLRLAVIVLELFCLPNGSAIRFFF